MHYSANLNNKVQMIEYSMFTFAQWKKMKHRVYAY